MENVCEFCNGKLCKKCINLDGFQDMIGAMFKQAVSDESEALLKYGTINKAIHSWVKSNGFKFYMKILEIESLDQAKNIFWTNCVTTFLRDYFNNSKSTKYGWHKPDLSVVLSNVDEFERDLILKLQEKYATKEVNNYVV